MRGRGGPRIILFSCSWPLRAVSLMAMAFPDKGATMQTISLPDTDLRVTPICFGTGKIGGVPSFETPERQQALRCIETAIESGINFIDTAPVYGLGRAEELLSEALRTRREEVVLATKCGWDWTSEEGVFALNIDNSRQSSLRTLKGVLEG